MSEELVSRLSDLFVKKGWKLALAESCTGGLLAAWITEQAGVSRFFEGSVVAYSNTVKKNILGVSSSTLATEGAVSEATAREMARGVRANLGSDWAIAVTGVAGPDGGSARKPVGTVCFAWAGPGIELAETQVFSGDRREIQKKSARHALEMLCNKAEMGI